MENCFRSSSRTPADYRYSAGVSLQEHHPKSLDIAVLFRIRHDVQVCKVVVGGQIVIGYESDEPNHVIQAPFTHESSQVILFRPCTNNQVNDIWNFADELAQGLQDQAVSLSWHQARNRQEHGFPYQLMAFY